MMDIIWWVIFGLVIGALAKLVMPGNQNMGWLMTGILGIVGSILGGWIAGLLGFEGASDNNMFSFWPIVFSVLGAVLVLWIYGKATTRK